MSSGGSDNDDEWVTTTSNKKSGGKGRNRSGSFGSSSGGGSGGGRGRQGRGRGRGGRDGGGRGGGRSSKPNRSQSFTAPGRSSSFHQQQSSSSRGGGGGRGGRSGGGGGNKQELRSHSFSIQRQHSHRGGGGGGGGRHPQQNTPQGRGVRRNRSQPVVSSSQQQQQQQQKPDNKNGSNKPDNKKGSPNKLNRYQAPDAELLQTTGTGTTPAQKQVRRSTPEVFFARRMQYLDAPPVRDSDNNSAQEIFMWTPHERCLWTWQVQPGGGSGGNADAATATTIAQEERLAHIQSEMDRFFDYKPLQVNEETRWKAKVMHDENNAGTGTGTVTDQQQEQIRRAVAILNKLSWTTLDKLTVQFLETVGATSSSSSGSSSSSEATGTTVAMDNEDGAAAAAVLVSAEVVRECMTLVVEKAMMEPHFAELYARFSFKLSNVHKGFKKTLLTLCQEQFEESDKAAAEGGPATAAAGGGGGETKDNGGDDDDDDNNKTATSEDEEMQLARQRRELALIKKRSIGLMKFIGELYKMKLIKGSIMLGCLQRLLQPNDEERLECYAQLMTTVGGRLHHAAAEQGGAESVAEMETLWKQTYSMAGRPYVSGSNNKKAMKNKNNKNKKQQPKPQQPLPDGPKAPSNRIKFLLQDLIELKENDWISQRRQEEKAKTIAEIHKAAAKEEEEAARRSARPAMPVRSQSFSAAPSSSSSRGSSFSNKSSSNRGQQQQQQTSNRVSAPPGALSSLAAAASAAVVVSEEVGDDDGFSSVQPRRSLRRAKSEAAQPQSSLQRSLVAPPPPPLGSPTRRSGMPQQSSFGTGGEAHRTPSELLTDSKIVEYLEPDECGGKMKSVLKEFFVGGDLDDAVMSVEDLVGVGDEGDVSRGTAVIRAGVLLVMEMKQVDVNKFQTLIHRCLDEDKMDKEALVLGLRDPLEFLRDIEIDAPMASSFLAEIVAGWVQRSALEFDFLLQAPEYFKTDGKPALFAAQVLGKLYGAGKGEEVSDSQVQVVSNLMSEEEKNAATSPREWVQSNMG